jgi:hypothetical protein
VNAARQQLKSSLSAINLLAGKKKIRSLLTCLLTRTWPLLHLDLATKVSSRVSRGITLTLGFEMG